MATTLPRRIVRGALRRLPGKEAAIRAIATAPSALKPPAVCRFLTRVVEDADLQRLGSIETNLGMRSNRVVIGGRAPAHYFFGRPDSYAGERGALTLSLALSEASDAFVDIGSHHGYFVFLVAHGLQRAIPIHYFEPDSELFAEIQANVQRQQLANVRGHRAAIGATSGTATFYTNLSDPNSSSLSREFATKHEVREDRVAISTFDDFAAANDVRGACVKVDIEHAEFAFLEGARNSSERIRFLIIEVLGPATAAGFVRAAQQQLGMHAYYINDLTLEHAPDGAFTYRAPEYNWLFCRESPVELRALLAHSALSVAAD